MHAGEVFLKLFHILISAIDKIIKLLKDKMIGNYHLKFFTINCKMHQGSDIFCFITTCNRVDTLFLISSSYSSHNSFRLQFLFNFLSNLSFLQLECFNFSFYCLANENLISPCPPPLFCTINTFCGAFMISIFININTRTFFTCTSKI